MAIKLLASLVVAVLLTGSGYATARTVSSEDSATAAPAVLEPAQQPRSPSTADAQRQPATTPKLPHRRTKASKVAAPLAAVCQAALTEVMDLNHVVGVNELLSDDTRTTLITRSADLRKLGRRAHSTAARSALRRLSVDTSKVVASAPGLPRGTALIKVAHDAGMLARACETEPK
jgi:hypothetical protein